MFAAHFESCDQCRAAIDQQRWIDGLLRSPIRAEHESPPASLVDAVRTTLRESRQRAGLIACVFAAAAALVIAVGWTALVDRPAEPAGDGRELVLNVDDSSTNSIGNRETPVAIATTPPRATVITGPDMLAVPIESPYPDVTIVRLYPTYRPEFTTHSAVSRPPADDDFAWPDDFNSNGGSL